MKIGIKNKDNPVPSLDNNLITRLIEYIKYTEDYESSDEGISLIKELKQLQNGVETNNEQPN